MWYKGRRTFLRLAILAVLALLVMIWNKLTLNHLNQLKQKNRILPFNKNKTVSFFENYIVVNQAGSTNVFSSHCTHLGCTINQTLSGKLVCPCHGSEYDLEGKVLKGPAYKNLESIQFRITADETQIEVES